MHAPLSTEMPARLTRRTLLTAVGLGALGAVAGCNPFSSAPETITVTAGSTAAPAAPTQSSPTALLGLIFTTRLHADHLTQAITEDKRDAALFTDLLADRNDHLAALEKEYRRQFGAAAPGGSAGSGGSATTSAGSATGATPSAAPADPDEVIGRIRGDATEAQSKFTDALATASRFQAELFASIAACIATHRMVLS